MRICLQFFALLYTQTKAAGCRQRAGIDIEAAEDAEDEPPARADNRRRTEDGMKSRRRTAATALKSGKAAKKPARRYGTGCAAGERGKAMESEGRDADVQRRAGGSAAHNGDRGKERGREGEKKKGGCIWGCATPTTPAKVIKAAAPPINRGRAATVIILIPRRQPAAASVYTASDPTAAMVTEWGEKKRGGVSLSDPLRSEWLRNTQYFTGAERPTLRAILPY